MTTLQPWAPDRAPAVPSTPTIVVVRNPWRWAVLGAAGTSIVVAIAAVWVARYQPEGLPAAVIGTLAGFALLVAAAGMHGRYSNRPPQHAFRTVSAGQGR